jgi:hypothetical protein
VASSELLCLCNHLLPIGSNLPKTIHKLKQCVGIEKVVLKEKRYCQVCKSEILASNVKGSKKNDWKCNNKDCQGSNYVEFDSFFYMDIAPQLEDLVKLNFEAIKNYSNEKRQNIDLIDGLYYSALKKANTLHLMVFSDGTPIKKATYKQFWPVFVGICELPRILRESIRNKIISGIWFGKTKPTSDILFEPFINDLKLINKKGIKINSSRGSFDFFVNLYGLLGDSPGRNVFINMKQYNGYYGCPFCITPGRWSAAAHKIIFDMEDYPLRTSQSFIEDGTLATPKAPINGIMGPTLISKLLDLNFTPIDYMHLVCLGIFKHILVTLFDSTNHNEPYYISISLYSF